MEKILNILSKGLSIALFPLLMPTYAVLFSTVSMANVSSLFVLIVVLFTFFITFMCPMTYIWVLIRSKRVKDIYMEEASERTIPYILCLVCFVIWNVFVSRFLPYFFSITVLGGNVALLCALLINLKWKISIHLVGMGCLLGGIINYCLFYGVALHSALLLVGLLALLLMYARLYLNAHTALQVVVGFLLGLVCTVGMYFIALK